MARRRSFASFAQGFALGQQMVNAYDKAQAARELRGIAEAKPETDTGYSDQQGADLRAAAATGLYDITANPDLSYSITGKAGGETGTMRPGERTTFLGKSYDKPPSDSDMEQARMQAMSGVMMKTDPAEAMRFRQQATQGRIAELQLSGAQRAEKSAVANDAINAAGASAAQASDMTTPAGRAQSVLAGINAQQQEALKQGDHGKYIDLFAKGHQVRSLLFDDEMKNADREFALSGDYNVYAKPYSMVDDGTSVTGINKKPDGSFSVGVRDASGKAVQRTVPNEAAMKELIMALRNPDKRLELEAKRAEIQWKAENDPKTLTPGSVMVVRQPDGTYKQVAQGFPRMAPGGGGGSNPGTGSKFDVDAEGNRVILYRDGTMVYPKGPDGKPQKIRAGSDVDQKFVRKLTETYASKALMPPSDPLSEARRLAQETSGPGGMPAGAARPQPARNLPTPQTQADFAKLPKGAMYVDPDDGKTYRKP